MRGDNASHRRSAISYISTDDAGTRCNAQFMYVPGLDVTAKTPHAGMPLGCPRSGACAFKGYAFWPSSLSFKRTNYIARSQKVRHCISSLPSWLCGHPELRRKSSCSSTQVFHLRAEVLGSRERMSSLSTIRFVPSSHCQRLRYQFPAKVNGHSVVKPVEIVNNNSMVHLLRL